MAVCDSAPASVKLAELIKGSEGIVVTGPGPAYISRMNDIFRRVIYVRAAEEAMLSDIPLRLKSTTDELYETCGVEVYYDFDPLHII